MVKAAPSSASPPSQEGGAAGAQRQSQRKYGRPLTVQPTGQTELRNRGAGQESRRREEGIAQKGSALNHRAVHFKYTQPYLESKSIIMPNVRIQK